MKHCVVAVHDSAVGAFNRPFYAPSVGAAIRSFSDEVQRKAEDNMMNRHPDDYALYLLADFDEESGEFSEPSEGRRVLIRGHKSGSVSSTTRSRGVSCGFRNR